MGWCYTCGKSIDEVTPEPARYSSDLSTAWAALEAFKALVPFSDARWYPFVTALPIYPLHMDAGDLSEAICKAIVNALSPKAQRLLDEVSPWATLHNSSVEMDDGRASGMLVSVLTAEPAAIVRAIILALPER